MYAEYCQKQRLLPEPLGLSETEPRALNLSHFGIGDAHAGAMAQGLRNMQGLRTLDLRENRLGDSAITVLLQNTAHLKLRKLDLSHSCVSRGAAKALGALLRESASLRVVILNKVRFEGDSFERICRALRTPTCTLRFLHLCDTGMGHTLATAETLGKMLSQNKSLVALNIAWNNISGAGAEALAQGIRANRTLHTLDARWNMLGTAATALGAALAKNRVLSHLDLSYNHITADQCKELAQGLNLNHSLLGLHMAGNAYKVSPAGFLIPRKYAVLDSTNAHKALVGQTMDTICNAELRHDPKAGLKRRAALQREKAAKEAEDRAYNKAHDPFATGSGPRRRGRLAIHGGQQQPPGVSPFGEDAPTAHERLAAATSAVTGHDTTASETATNGPVNEHQHGSPSGRVISFRSAIVAVTTRNRNKRHLPNLLDVVRLKREQDKKKKTPHLENSEPECEHCWICARWREVRVDFVDFAAAEEAAMASAAEELRRQEEREEIRRQMENNPFKQRVVAQKTAPKPKTTFKPRHIEMFLSIDGFRRPRKLAYVDGDFKYEAHVMLPPGRCEFFFTVDGEMNRVLASNMHAAEASPEARHAFELLIKRKQESKDGDTIPLPWRLKDKNQQPHKQRYSPDGPLRLHSFAILERLEKTLPDTIRAIPRRQNARAIPRRRLSFLQEDGVFAALGKESTEDTVKAFKADCSHAKFQRVVKDKDERNNMLSALQENYSILRVVYQLFCANHTGLSVTSVSWHSFFEFCQMCLIVDDKLDQKDLENMFVAVNVNDASRDQGVDMTGRKLNPDRDLCRYEFVEIVGRIAIKKFFQRGLVDSPADAVRRLVETHFLPYLDIEAPQVFRERFMFNQPVDLIFQHFLPVMQRLFRRAADSHLNRKSKRMTFMAWRNLITKSGIFSNAACTERESRIAYRLSMKYVEDEMKTDKHLSIGFLEFLEALARLAFLSDQASLAHLVKRFSQIFDAQSRLEESFKKTNDNNTDAAATKGQALTVSPAEEDADKRANNTKTKTLPSPKKIRDESTKTALSTLSEPQSPRSVLRQSTLSEGELEALLREDPDAEDSSLDSSSEDDNEEDENGRGAGCGQGKDFGVVHLNLTSGFPLKLSLLLRILIWHPIIYDRANLKAITSEKRHQELLSRRGSLRITASSHLH
ncbi:NACHT, LRR and PYD domains-containing protein 3 [Hondaea fermentalgiana]|uniref:NACHT, LRR and PYD domains-containing protein 3 n=1 Tax=Hondaea fermentalgiana TaxID=2315210 RepID=A0A2R5GB29_9STRA|nr:NACHT, LRR and PYD domains-containing protein 3 [Hondaea fermentalgiana]|eukprot:GBG27539.1 NACHT, LRR and PYD domains-containing protein 3 [Hondaea fermentalgiana]